MKRAWFYIALSACVIWASGAQAVNLVAQKIAPNVYAFIGELGGRAMTTKE